MELAVALLALFLAIPAFFVSIYNFVVEKVRHDSMPKEVIVNREQALSQAREVSRGFHGEDVPSIYDNLEEDREAPDFEEIL